jgi:hypothetical protein
MTDRAEYSASVNKPDGSVPTVSVQLDLEGDQAYAVLHPRVQAKLDSVVSARGVLEEEALKIFSRKNEELTERITDLEGQLREKDKRIDTLIEANHGLQGSMVEMFQTALAKVPSGS